MAEAEGLVVPQLAESTETILGDIREFDTTVTSDYMKSMIEFMAGFKEGIKDVTGSLSTTEEKISNIHDIQNKKSESQEEKLQSKNTGFWFKIFKNKWFEKALAGLQRLGEGAGSFLFDLLKFLMLAALFPGLFKMIVGFLISMGLMLFRILASILPGHLL